LPVSIRLRYWLDAMRERESVKAARTIAEGHIEAIRDAGAAQPPVRGAGKVEFLHA
jgi:hypothetical protein